MNVSEPWDCPTCGHAVPTEFCPKCGETRLRPRDLTLGGFFEQILEASTNLNGPLIRSFRYLMMNPGSLTVSYLVGQRKRYTMPLQLFLLANVLFFAVQSAIGTKVLSTPLESHLHSQLWSDTAQSLVTHRLETLNTTLELYAPIFDQAVALNAKSLIILMVLPFALLPPVLFYRARRPFVTHVVFSLHFYTFLLVLFCLALAAVGIDIMRGGAGLNSETFDHALSTIELAASAVYLYFATGRVYGGSGFARAAKVVPLVVAAAGIFLGYRFVLLLITLHTT